MEFTLKRLTDMQILSFYEREIVKKYGKKEANQEFILPSACIAGLLAKKLYKGYALWKGRKRIGFSFLVSDSNDSTFLLHYLYILEPYRGYNYTEIMLEMMISLINYENKERREPASGIFIEVRGTSGLEKGEYQEREKELRFFKEMGAYLTDIVPEIQEEYNVLFLPIFSRLTMEELKVRLFEIYKNILPSFKDNRKYITRYTQEIG